MNLLYGRMPLTKSELVMWDPLVWPQIFVYFSKYKFSKTSEKTDRRLIGQYEVISVGSFPGLTIVIICEILDCLGQYDIHIIPLKNVG
jgi:hypothetical protein